jgi:hypothetical protein
MNFLIMYFFLRSKTAFYPILLSYYINVNYMQYLNMEHLLNFSTCFILQ